MGCKSKLSYSNGLHDDFQFNEDFNELIKDANGDPKGILQNLEAKIERLNDHGMDLMAPKKAPKKMINLILQDQYQNLLER